MDENKDLTLKDIDGVDEKGNPNAVPADDGSMSPEDAKAVGYKCPKHKTDLMKAVQHEFGSDEPPHKYWVCYECAGVTREGK